MRHNQYKLDFDFIKKPIYFDKNTEKEQLAYCLGATLYMPATKNFFEVVTKQDIPGLTSIVVCFEDAIDEKNLPKAEDETLKCLHLLRDFVDSGNMSRENLPLIFFRVRTVDQFKSWIEKLSSKDYNFITGFVFPKFLSKNGGLYFSFLEELNRRTEEPLYGMPILEGREIAFKETRWEELKKLRKILLDFRPYVLNVRVGGTDFSSCFGVRRGIDYSIYDILTVKDCLLDILNFFSRDNEFVISGPVWEYFLASKEMKFDEDLEVSLQSSVLKRKKIINEAVDGLLREVIIDKANGFVGKTAIHPSHVKYINAMQAVTEEEYDDAVQILKTSGGVIKSEKANKMNEINPHRSWAKKIYYKALAYGVIKDEAAYIKLVSGDDFTK